MTRERGLGVGSHRNQDEPPRCAFDGCRQHVDGRDSRYCPDHREAAVRVGVMDVLRTRIRDAHAHQVSLTTVVESTEFDHDDVRGALDELEKAGWVKVVRGRDGVRIVKPTAALESSFETERREGF